MRLEDWYALTERDEERALRRNVRARDFRRNALECAGGLLAVAMGVTAAWISLAAFG